MAITLDDEKNEYLRQYLQAANDPQVIEKERQFAQQAADERRANAMQSELADAASLMGTVAGQGRADVSGYQKALGQRSAAAEAQAASQIGALRGQQEAKMNLNKYLADKFEGRQAREQQIAAAQAEKQAGRDWDVKKMGMEQQNRVALEELKAKNDREIAALKSGGMGGLPKENQDLISKLTDKNANKISISNQMEGYLDNYRKAQTPDQKVVIGRQMLKVLNSPEGADAIGAEEAARLGSLLENQVFNIRGPGPMFGRDLQGFDTQVVDTLNSVRQSINLNNQMIGKAKSGQSVSDMPQSMAEYQKFVPQGSAMASQYQPTTRDTQAMQWLQANPTAPEAAGIRAKLQKKGLISGGK